MLNFQQRGVADRKQAVSLVPNAAAHIHFTGLVWTNPFPFGLCLPKRETGSNEIALREPGNRLAISVFAAGDT